MKMAVASFASLLLLVLSGCGGEIVADEHCDATKKWIQEQINQRNEGRLRLVDLKKTEGKSIAADGKSGKSDGKEKYESQRDIDFPVSTLC